MSSTHESGPSLVRGAGFGAPGKVTGVGLGVSVLWLSLVVLVPLAAVVAKAAGYGWTRFAHTLTNDAVAAAIRLTVAEAALVTVLNIVMGTIIAWVLVRDSFPGKALVELVIDLPFALPTIVAGLVLLSLVGPKSPIGWQASGTRVGVFLALAFVTVPFVVRTVQPVLMELDRDVEEAAASLGASRSVIFRRIILPNLLPAIAAGSALSFARAMSEYGSLVLLSGNLPFRTEVASVKILGLMENDNPGGAASVAVVLLAVSVLTLVLIDVTQRWVARRG